MNLHGSPSENVITAATVLTMLDTCSHLRACCEPVAADVFRTRGVSRREGKSAVSVLISGRLISGLSVARHSTCGVPRVLMECHELMHSSHR